MSNLNKVLSAYLKRHFQSGWPLTLPLIYSVLPLHSNRQHLSSGASLEHKREDNQNCYVLGCVQQLCTCTHTC